MVGRDRDRALHLALDRRICDLPLIVLSSPAIAILISKRAKLMIQDLRLNAIGRVCSEW